VARAPPPEPLVGTVSPDGTQKMREPIGFIADRTQEGKSDHRRSSTGAGHERAPPAEPRAL